MSLQHLKWILSLYWLKATPSANTQPASWVLSLHRHEVRRPENQVVKTVRFHNTVHTLLFAFSSDCENRSSSRLSLTFCLLPFPRCICHFLSLWPDHLSLFWLSDSTTDFLRTAPWQIDLAAAWKHFFSKYYVMTQVNVVTQLRTTCR